jgi:hypothetical protein
MSMHPSFEINRKWFDKGIGGSTLPMEKHFCCPEIERRRGYKFVCDKGIKV